MNKIFITGDIHGDPSRFSINSFSEQKELDKNDYVIITGDFGLIWSQDPNNKNEKYWLDWLDNKPFTTLYIDGNHENFDRLNNFPISEWNGGKVHKIRESVIHLMRGEVYNLANHKFFTFGGAPSHDITGLATPEELTEYCDKLKEKLQRFLEQGAYFTLKEQKEPKWNHNYNENDNNLMIEVSDFASYKKSFKKTFKFIDKTYNLPSTFTVGYGDLKAKQLPYFSTSASNKYQGGQAQDELLPKYHILREFWEQWKMYHCRPLTKYEYNCLLKDLEIVENELANMND